MFTKLRLKNFKNFQDAELALGPLTLLVGANASGKSNLRDAFRFLHGIGRGYSLANIIGTKYGEGGEPQWGGMRGGPREIAFQGAETFALEVSCTIDDQGKEREAIYHIEVDPGTNGSGPRVIAEHLVAEGQGDFVFDSTHMQQRDPLYLSVQQTGAGERGRAPYIIFRSQQPILSQIVIASSKARSRVKKMAQATLDVFGSMRFLDLSPDSMKQPSFSGQNILGDRGENLSSVLQAICADPQRKHALVQWLQELTPMDAIDFEFPPDQIGRVLVTLVEEHGQRTTAYSASDGTLRFLGMLAALLGPESARLYCFEELETGIHPNRIDLLLQLIEQQVAQKNIQIVATTHSPQLLRLISPATLNFASLTYRLEDRPDAQIKRILDIPEARRIIEEQDIARLHESGWLEDAVEFSAVEEAV
jgi:predicted ATPase